MEAEMSIWTELCNFQNKANQKHNLTLVGLQIKKSSFAQTSHPSHSDIHPSRHPAQEASKFTFADFAALPLQKSLLESHLY